MKTPVDATPEGGAKYSFIGRPDFNRIIRENEGADVIIVSRGDGLQNFLFRVGLTPDGKTARLNTLTRLMKDSPYFFIFSEKAVDSREPGVKLAPGWVQYNAADPTQIKELRRLAQRFVALRTGKHTVEVLPA